MVSPKKHEEDDVSLYEYDFDIKVDDDDEEEDDEKEKVVKDDDVLVVTDEEYDPDHWEGVHPAEVAARLQRAMKSDRSPGGSDEVILKDLRKSVFSVPLMPQKEVQRLFNVIDSEMQPVVYAIMDSSHLFLEEVFQIVIKVAAGNTYGKNIYEKSDNPTPESEFKTTYKSHEVEFLGNAFGFFSVFANSFKDGGQGTDKIKAAVDKCLFIRGVYEEVIANFLSLTKNYRKLHWDAFECRVEKNHEQLSRVLADITLIDQRLRLKKSIFGLILKAETVTKNFTSIRSTIIAPYLRSVYSTAKNTAKNAHQMLDNFQNGSIGLIRAISCYSTKRSASFASVAKWWIKQMMLLSIKEDANFVKLPVSTWQAYTQLEKAKFRINGSDDDIETIAKAAKMPTKKAKSVYDTVKIAQVFSLNKPYDADEKLTLEDIITNENKLGYADYEFEDLVRYYCSKADLTQPETRILALRHGMFDILKEPTPSTNTEIVNEALRQNLACLGYAYRIKCTAS